MIFRIKIGNKVFETMDMENMQYKTLISRRIDERLVPEGFVALFSSIQASG
jgi:hypothetical protein